ncbi:DUF1476 domain-containing protein [Pseudooceanicola sp. HF7]|uniref:DUF1476 domain-containing protein n=1 Tax=Pseudooceanicola sp. HF7 TaxID=2721560 RepID=UPI0014320F5D|nr:DUF1476 domain-containing protein [Pseudooceanicola sp. HF7]NIZ08656.1 DUF1476 domain-containing protein [Pseudooceanicola sp. HF7]
MRTFDERERAYEAKFALDQDRLFAIRARRDRLVGLWAAGILRLPEAEAETYAQSNVQAGLAGTSGQGVLARLTQDLTGYATEAQIAERMADYLVQAAEDPEAA